MSDQADNDLYSQLVQHWTERDEIELERRSAGWYKNLVEFLCWQPSLSDWPSAIENAGEIDSDELSRAVAECALLAVEEGRRARYALLTFVGEEIRLTPPYTIPAPPHSDFDVLAELKRRVQLQTWQLLDDRAAEAVNEGRYGQALGILDDMRSKIRQITDEERRALPRHELMQLQLKIGLNRATALLRLSRLDHAAAAFRSVVDEASAAGLRGLGWFNEREIRIEGMRGLAHAARGRGQADLAAEIFRNLIRTTAGWQYADLGDITNLGLALLDSFRPRLALGEFRRVRELVAPGEPSAFTLFGEADCIRLLGDAPGAHAIYREQFRRGLDEEDWLRVVLFADRVSRGMLEPDDTDIRDLSRARSGLVPANVTRAELRVALALVSALRATGDAATAIELAEETVGRIAPAESASPELLRLRLNLADMLADNDAGVVAAGTAAAEEHVDLVLEAVDALVNDAVISTRKSEIMGDWVDAFGLKIALHLRGHPDRPARAGPTPAEGGGTGAPVISAFDLHEGAKAPGFAAALARGTGGDSLSDAPPTLVAREARLHRIVLSVEARDPLGSGSAGQQLERLASLHRQRREVEEELGRIAPDYVRRRRGAAVAAGELADVLQSASPVPTAAVSFFCDQRTTTAFVIRSDDTTVRAHQIPIGRETLSELAAALSRAYNGAPEEGYPPILRNRPWRRDLAAWSTLSADFLRCTEGLDGIEMLIIAPHGPLHLLPLHALRLQDGRYLASRFTISYVPSLTSLANLLSGKDGSRPQRVPAQAYVAGVAAREDAHPELFEGDADLFAGDAWSCAADIGPVLASKERVLNGIAAADVVHLTCHGVFSPGFAARTGLMFSDGTDRPPRTDRELSPAARKRFLLSVSDLLGRDVGARLVTLRACSSGMQRMRNAGDEFESFARTFLQCGSRAVLVSLWNVDQRSSKEFLSRFYSEWAAHGGQLSLAAALSRAQRSLIDSADPVSRHPYHWAPFALVGDWR
jgi:tetratricopeptide (TPR) repeat protein